MDVTRGGYLITTERARIPAMETIAADPRLGGFRRWMLATRDAHGLCAQTGYAALATPECWMERRPIVNYPGPGSDPPPA